MHSFWCGVLAEREGFEPSIPVRVCRFSRTVVSTTHASLPTAGILGELVCVGNVSFYVEFGFAAVVAHEADFAEDRAIEPGAVVEAAD